MLAGLAGTLLLGLAACTADEKPGGRGSIDDEQPTPQATPTEAELPLTPEVTPTEAPAAKFNLYREMSEWEYVFSSGVGGWQTGLTFYPDGSFSGSYYDSDMGDTGPGYENGTMYVCDFSGKCGVYTEEAPGIFRVDIDSLHYDAPNSESFKNDVRYITAGPYGLDSSNELIVYLPGTDVAELDPDFLSWVHMLNFSVYTQDGIYDDSPAELPFCGIFNPAGYGFYAMPAPGHNKMCIKDEAKIPGLVNRELTFNADGTYYCEDADEEEHLIVQAAAYRLDSSFPNATNNPEAFVSKCMKLLPGCGTVGDLVLWDDSFDAALCHINGEPALYASWTDDGRYCRGIFCYNYEAGSVGAASGNVQMYVMKEDEGGVLGRGEYIENCLHSLEKSGSYEGLSSASEHVGDHWQLVETNGGDGGHGIYGDDVVWINGDDLATLAQYGIDPSEVYDDYAIGAADGDYRTYELLPDCAVYLRFTDNIFKRLTPVDVICADPSQQPYERLMWLLLDENDKVIAMYEPYTP